MSRYMMPIDDAVGLCFDAMGRMRGGEVFILKMPRVRVGDLVEVLIEAYAPSFGFRTDEIEVQTIGARPGEKRHEVLLTDDEAQLASDVDGMFVVHGPAGGERHPGPVTGGRGDEPLLSHPELRELLDSAGWLRPEERPHAG